MFVRVSQYSEDKKGGRESREGVAFSVWMLECVFDYLVFGRTDLDHQGQEPAVKCSPSGRRMNCSILLLSKAAAGTWRFGFKFNRVVQLWSQRVQAGPIWDTSDKGPVLASVPIKALT